MARITIYAEKPDVGCRIATAFGGVFIPGKKEAVDSVEYEKYSKKILQKYGKDGYIPFSYHGDEYFVTWGSGHMCALKQAKDYNSEYQSWSKIPKPFFPEKYEIKIRPGVSPKTKKKTAVDQSAKKQLQTVKSLFQKSDFLINATDDDREGELIFAYVYEFTNTKKPYKRVFLESYTKEGISKAFSNLKEESDVKPVEMAGRARNIADWLVGANLTVATTLAFGKAFSNGKKPDVVSVGRVQTPTLNLLVTREKEIENFKPAKTYFLHSEFTTDSGEKYLGDSKSEWKEKRDANDALSSLRGKQGCVDIYKVRDGYKEAPLLYSLSTLSMDANKAYGMTAKETLDAAQSLYTRGFTTYPRTSSCYLPDDMKGTVHLVLDALSKLPDFAKYILLVPKEKRQMTKRHYNSSKVESHYAIIPTNQIPDFSTLSPNEEKIYRLVAHSLIRSIFPPAKVRSVKVETLVGEERFLTNGTTVLEKNWMVVSHGKTEESKVPLLSEGEMVFANPSVKEKTSRPPNRYTDSSLISAMITAGKKLDEKHLADFMAEQKNTGIGTEATRAGIIEMVIGRGYARRQGKYIVPTEKGRKLIEVLPIEDLKSAAMTAKWEERLDKIQNGEDTKERFIQDMEQKTKIWVQEVYQKQMAGYQQKETGLRCPNCGGYIIENQYGFFCENNERNNPDSCQFRAFKSSQRFPYSPDLTEDDMKSIIDGGKSGVKAATSKKGNSFAFFYRLDDDNQTLTMEFANR